MSGLAALMVPTSVPELDERAAVQALKELSSHVSYGVVASASGTAPATVRAVILTGALPKREGPRRALIAFASANVGVRERRSLVFV